MSNAWTLSTMTKDEALACACDPIGQNAITSLDLAATGLQEAGLYTYAELARLKALVQRLDSYLNQPTISKDDCYTMRDLIDAL